MNCTGKRDKKKKGNDSDIDSGKCLTCGLNKTNI